MWQIQLNTHSAKLLEAVPGSLQPAQGCEQEGVPKSRDSFAHRGNQARFWDSQGEEGTGQSRAPCNPEKETFPFEDHYVWCGERDIGLGFLPIWENGKFSTLIRRMSDNGGL